jgi:hypothetical protein
MSRKILGVAIFVVLAAVTALFLITKFTADQTIVPSGTPTPTPVPIHYHAIFNIYVDDKLQDYSAFKFMNTEPCNLHSDAVSENDQLEKAHLHDLVGDVVHVHRDNAIWDDLLLNLKINLSKPVIGYVDGVKVGDILSQPIKKDSRVLILSGTNTDVDNKLSKLPLLQHLRDVETHSESCGVN